MYKKYLARLPADMANKSIFLNKQTFLLILAYFAIRFSSYLLVGHIIIESITVFVVIMAFGTIYYKNQEWGWYILITELLLGGAGHFFEFLGLSIRTILLLIFVSLWIIETISNSKQELFNFPKKLSYFLIVFSVFVAIASIIGLANQHGIKPVIQDLIPYSFFVLIFPAYHILHKQCGQEYLIRLMIAFVISSSIFALITFILFSSGTEYLQSPFYKWFRDVAMGKITDMGSGFFRIVTPEHLLATPIVLIISSLLMKSEKHHKMWWFLLFPALLILVLNFSRIYFLSLIAGMIVLKYKHSFKRWISISALVLSLLAIIFAGTNIIASRGSSLGFELLKGRLNSISNPTTEASSFTRMTLLEPIFEMITEHPLIGSGLGSKVTFTDPVKNIIVQTSNFDWGYLELWVELGLFGAIAFISLIFYVIYNLIKKIRCVSNYYDFYVGILAGLISLLIMNITSPILFHTLGVFYLVFVIVISAKHHSLLDKIVILLYRTFHRLKKQ